MKINKTNAARLLDKAGIKYELIPYQVDESDLSAVHVASVLGEDVNRVYKTIVLRGDRNGIFVCVIPGESEVDLKKAARVSGNKSASTVHVKELLGLTGYIRGGCSPVGMKKPYPVFISSGALSFDYVFVSAGVRGLQMKLAPGDLIAVTGAVPADII
ncbi:aminoacyl-tRNA deacylase [Muribaculum sp. An289]|uniref:Cys-tRNA(Pro) deacylase n=1 Tax=unclassified Muribaculum TaxID=2622126 RepID=UPI000B39D072|nr:MULTISPECIES: Cys-tRNA(Pro) deacylase [unclassified Muribaculum]OUO35391.1 aminoacyl-tRNA deacylase [Muribaculum sp. An289]OUO40491.1 aminoacyl-tRNA deacylase [Muribaculum sp. An287]